jgi:hypothetical protein
MRATKAERVLAGENPAVVLTTLRPFVPRYDDPWSRGACDTSGT